MKKTIQIEFLLNTKKNFESATVFAAQNTNITGKRSNFSIGMNTSLILTDSAFAINKPINGGSFVLLDPTDGNFSFSSNSINQNITKNVIVPVSPYRNGSILVSPEFSPEENFNLKEDNVSYNVSEKGSLTSKLKVIKTITVNGILLSKNGIPLSLYEGRVRKEDSSSSIEFMTDEEGRFSLDLPIAETNKDDQRLNLILLSYPEKVLAIKIKPNSEEKEINLYKSFSVSDPNNNVSFSYLTTSDAQQSERIPKIDWSNHIFFNKEVCKQYTLERVLTENNVPKNFDILIVDVEGNERDVLNSFSINEWKPKMMIIEIEDENQIH